MCIQKHHKMQYLAVSFDRCKTWSYPCFNTSHNEERSILLKMNASQHGTERKIATVILQENIRRNLRPSAITRKRLRKSDAQVLSPEKDTRLYINPRKDTWSYVLSIERHLRSSIVTRKRRMSSEIKCFHPKKGISKKFTYHPRHSRSAFTFFHPN